VVASDSTSCRLATGDVISHIGQERAGLGWGQRVSNVHALSLRLLI